MGGGLVVGPGFKEEDAAGAPPVLCPGLAELFEGFEAVVFEVAESIRDAAVEKNGGARFDLLQHPPLVLELSQEYLALEFTRVGAQLVEGRVANQLGGCLGYGQLPTFCESIDDGCLP